MLFDLWVDRTSLKDTLRCVIVETGGLSVVIRGMKRKQLWSADKLDSQET